MGRLAKIVSTDTRKEIRYIRPDDIIPKGWRYIEMAEVQEVSELTEEYVLKDWPDKARIYNMDPAKGGIKSDTGKNRLELIHPDILFGIGEVMTLGALKYDDWNWYKGMSWSRVYGSLERHIKAWYKGQDLDEESGKSHLWHAACCLMFLITYQEQGKGTDDRPT